MPTRAAIVLLLLAFVSVGFAAACEPTLEQQSGVVIDIDSPALGRVDSFELLTAEGERLIFDMSEMEFRSEFPAPHLAEHRILGDRIIVTYKQDRDRRVVTQLDDGHP